MNLAHLHRAVEWVESGYSVARATVIDIAGSAPRDLGATIFVRGDSNILGTLSGGCVESDVITRCIRTLGTDKGATAVYGADVVASEDPFAIGLTCGGSIEVLTAPLSTDLPAFDLLNSSLEKDLRTALVTIIEGKHTGRTLAASPKGVKGLDDIPSLRDTLGSLAREAKTGISPRDHGRPRTFVQTFAPRPRMFVFGVSDFCTAMTRMGKTLGYRTIACDARETFMSPTRFPHADEVIVGRPEEVLAGAEIDTSTVICCMTHDRRWDVPLLREALRTPAAYIGMIGSRRAQEEMRKALTGLGVDATAIDRISGPMGLDLRARSPEEVSISIAAEILLVTKGGSGNRLVDSEGPVRGTLS